MADHDRPNASELRVSDSDRELTLERLRDALSEGRIDAADFDDRAGRTGQLRWGSLEVRGPRRKFLGR